MPASWGMREMSHVDDLSECLTGLRCCSSPCRSRARVPSTHHGSIIAQEFLLPMVRSGFHEGAHYVLRSCATELLNLTAETPFEHWRRVCCRHRVTSSAASWKQWRRLCVFKCMLFSRPQGRRSSPTLLACTPPTRVHRYVDIILTTVG